MDDKNIKLITNNKKAYHEYFLEETFEAGIALVGSEVKSIRQNGASLKDSYITVKKGEVLLIGSHIAPYEKGSFFNVNAKRDRKLLLNRSEIDKLRGKVEQRGYTIIATKMYFKQSLVKVEIALAKGKELHDKRQALAEKQQKRDIERELKYYR